MMRPKPFLTYFILCAIPLLLLAGLNYWNGIRTANASLNTILENDLDSFNGAVDEVLEERGRDVLRLAIDPAVQDVLSKKEIEHPRLQTARDLNEYFRSVTLFTSDRRAFAFRSSDGDWTFVNIDPAKLPKPDSQVWTSQGNVLFKNAGSTSETFEYSAPVNDGKTGTNLGAVVGVLDLQRVFATAARGLKSRSSKIVVVDSNAKTI
ncbi:MAG TPA: cache domain-containing protein, partial [Pyrinomonadaceae bacterium]|nr:cache domain-containing protein [Pyrinomonadaceae bacterium]